MSLKCHTDACSQWIQYVFKVKYEVIRCSLKWQFAVVVNINGIEIRSGFRGITKFDTWSRYDDWLELLADRYKQTKSQIHKVIKGY